MKEKNKVRNDVEDFHQNFEEPASLSEEGSAGESGGVGGDDGDDGESVGGSGEDEEEKLEAELEEEENRKKDLGNGLESSPPKTPKNGETSGNLKGAVGGVGDEKEGNDEAGEKNEGSNEEMDISGGENEGLNGGGKGDEEGETGESGGENKGLKGGEDLGEGGHLPEESSETDVISGNQEDTPNSPQTLLENGIVEEEGKPGVQVSESYLIPKTIVDFIARDPAIVEGYVRVLEGFRENPPKINFYIISFLKRTAEDCNLAPLMYRVCTFL